MLRQPTQKRSFGGASSQEEGDENEIFNNEFYVQGGDQECGDNEGIDDVEVGEGGGAGVGGKNRKNRTKKKGARCENKRRQDRQDEGREGTEEDE